MSKTSDPVNGEHIQQYVDIVTGADQDSALFEVAPGLQVIDSKVSVPRGEAAHLKR